MSRQLGRVILFLIILGVGRIYASDYSGQDHVSMTGTVSNSIGAMTAQASTDQFSGAFNTGIDISVPSGRRNIQPDLKLSYNSRGGSGWVGLGWSLSLASITRSMDRGIPAYDGTDDFLFSGQELIPFAGDTFRLKKESSFMKFEKDETNNKWIGTDLTGTEYYFGTCSIDGNTPSARTGRSTGTFGGTFQWYLVGVKDIFGNYMIIRYQQPYGTNGYYYPESIKYTGNADVQSGGTPYYEVSFTLESRTDITPMYTTGFKVNLNRRLHTIDIKANGITIRTYTLSYEDSPNSGYNRLTSVQISAPNETALPPTRFEYYDGSTSEKGWAKPQNNTWDLPIAFGAYNNNGGNIQKDYGTRLADLNGDGFVDVIRILKRSLEETFDYFVYINTGLVDSNTLWVRSSAWENALANINQDANIAFSRYKSTDDSYWTNSMIIMDINGDALPDLIYSKNGTNKVYLNIFNGTQVGWTLSNWAIPVDMYNGYYFDLGVRFGDLNGDGLVDILQSDYYGAAYRDAYLNNGDGTWTQNQDLEDSLQDTGKYFMYTGAQLGLRMLDFNGDGLADLFWAATTMSGYHDGWFNNGEYEFQEAPDAWEKFYAFNEPYIDPYYSGDLGVRLLDANGDGLLDMMQLLEGATLCYGGSDNHLLIHKSNLHNDRWEDQGGDYGIDGLPHGLRCYAGGYANADRGLREADINGDGLVDLIHGNISDEFDSGTWDNGDDIETYLNKGSVQIDKMIRIDNGQGVRTHISYKSSHDQAFLENAACNNDSNRLPNPMPVVDKIVNEMYDGATYVDQTKSEFIYCGGYLYAGNTTVHNEFDHKQEFRGFGHVRQTLSIWDGSTWDKKSRGDTWFNQDQGRFLGPFVGTADEQDSYVWDGSTFDLVSETLSSYTVTDIDGSTSREIYYTYSTQQDSWVYDGESIHTQAKSKYVFDTTDVQIDKMISIQEGVVGDTGDQKYTETEYSYLNSNWVQKIKRTWMTTSISAGGTTANENNRISEKRFYYDANTTPGEIDSKGLLTKTEELLTDTNPNTTPGSTAYIATWWVPDGVTDYDTFGNLIEWMDFGVHKQFEYETTLHTYPEVAITGGSTIGHKVKTGYKYNFGKAYYSIGPYEGSTPSGVSTWSRFDGYGRTTHTFVAPDDGNSVVAAEYTYVINTCAAGGCIQSNWPPVKVIKDVYDGVSSGDTSKARAVTIYDCAGRAIQEKTEGSSLGDTTYQKVADVEYDVLGNKTLSTEPYFVQVDNSDTTWLDPDTHRGSTVGKTVYSYDERNRPVMTELKYGATTITLAEVSYSIDNNFAYKAVTDAEGNETESVQDALGRLAFVTGAPGTTVESTTFYYYNGLDNLIETQVCAGQTCDDPIDIVYDSLSRKISMVDPDMYEWQYTYDARGNLKCQVDVGGQNGGSGYTVKTCYDYDSFNRLKRKYFLDDEDNEIDSDYLYFHERASNYETGWTHVWYVYDTYDSDTCTPTSSISWGSTPLLAGMTVDGSDPLGKLTMVCNMNDDDDELTYVTVYDDYGRAKRNYSAWDNLGAGKMFTYDRLDRVLSTTLNLPGDTTKIKYQYNNGGELKKVYDNWGNVYAIWGSTTERGYNSKGQELDVRYGNSTDNQWAYQAGTGKLTDLVTNGPGDTVYQDFNYSIDNTGNITGITNNLDADSVYYFGNIDTFKYDSLNRLSSVKIHGWENCLSFDHTYNYAYANNGNLTQKTNFVSGVGTRAINISYSGHQATNGTINGTTTPVFENAYDNNGNRYLKRFYQAGVHGSTDQYLYNTDNKMVQVLEADSAESSWTRISDAFYHLDGSRMWEGMMAEGNPIDIEGEFSFFPDLHLRLTSRTMSFGSSFLTHHIFANGRRIATRELGIWNESMGEPPYGCNVSPWTRLKHAPFAVLFINSLVLLSPVVLFILIRGWFFDKTWRGRRARNTLTVLLVFVFFFGITPMPSNSQALPTDLQLWMHEHLQLRLQKMYGNPDRVPALHPRASNRWTPHQPKAGTGILLRDALFYFAPGMKQEFEAIFPREARNEEGRTTREAKRETGDDTRQASAASSSSSSGQAFLPVDSSKVGSKAAALQSELQSHRHTKLRDLDEERSAQARLAARDSSGEGRGRLARALRSVVELIGPKTAYAWEGPNSWSIQFYHTDHLGSTRLITSEDGTLYEAIDYLPFGEIFRDDCVADYDFAKRRNKYTGQMWDYMTGLYYYGARYYDAELGRFTQADTVVPEPSDSQTFNRYAYCANNPYKYTDPSGNVHWLVDFCVSVVTAVLAATGLWAVAMLVSAAYAGIVAAIEGATFEQSMLAAGMSALGSLGGQFIKGIGSKALDLILFATGVVLAANQNDPNAWASMAGSLIGGIAASVATSDGYSFVGANDKDYINDPNAKNVYNDWLLTKWDPKNENAQFVLYTIKNASTKGSLSFKKLYVWNEEKNIDEIRVTPLDANQDPLDDPDHFYRDSTTAFYIGPSVFNENPKASYYQVEYMRKGLVVDAEIVSAEEFMVVINPDNVRNEHQFYEMLFDEFSHIYTRGHNDQSNDFIFYALKDYCKPPHSCSRKK